MILSVISGLLCTIFNMIRVYLLYIFLINIYFFIMKFLQNLNFYRKTNPITDPHTRLFKPHKLFSSIEGGGASPPRRPPSPPPPPHRRPLPYRGRRQVVGHLPFRSSCPSKLVSFLSYSPERSRRFDLPQP